MGLHETEWAWRQPTKNSSEKVLLLAIAKNHTPSGNPLPVKALAALAGLRLRTTYFVLHRLEEGGHITTRKYGQSNQIQISLNLDVANSRE